MLAAKTLQLAERESPCSSPWLVVVADCGRLWWALTAEQRAAYNHAAARWDQGKADLIVEELEATRGQLDLLSSRAQSRSAEQGAVIASGARLTPAGWSTLPLLPP